MGRRKGEARQSTLLRHYPFRASMQIDYWRTLAEQEAVSAAAASISDGDYLTTAKFAVESGMTWHFRTSAEAHAMQVWLEGHVRPYDPWEDRQRSYEASCRRMRQMADIINGAAATGVLLRILQTPRHRERVELLRAIEPRIGQSDAERAVQLIMSSAPYPGL